MTDIATLAARVDELESTLAIYRLEARYSRTWDMKLPEEWAAVFTDDGVFERQEVVGLPGLRRAGHAELAAFCTELNATSNYLHMMHSHEIDVHGDTATGTIFFECRKASTGRHPTTGKTTGFYNVDYVRTDAGWRMRERRERHVFRDEGYFYDLA